MELLDQFGFLDLLLLGSLGFLFFIGVLSIYRFVKLEERFALLLRHAAGFIVGLIDQTFMVIFNFQEEFLAIVVLFDYAAYCCWFMVMPNLLEFNKKKLCITLWILISAALNTIFEHVSLILVFGSLQYPTYPIIWTGFHTIVFYIGMHCLGSITIILGFKKENNII